jgi:hypothetical protein
MSMQLPWLWMAVAASAVVVTAAIVTVVLIRRSGKPR